MLAVQHVRDACESHLDHHRRRHTVSGAHAGEVERLLHMLGIPDPTPQARHLLRRVRDRVTHARLVEARKRGGSRRGAERGARPLGASVRGPHEIRSKGEKKAAADVVAERHGSDEIGSRSTLSLRHGERGGNHRASRMRLRNRLEIVGFVRMRAHAIRERSVDRGGPDVSRDDRRFCNAALCASVPNRHLARLEPRAGHHGAQRVEDAVLRLPCNGRGQAPFAGAGHISREPTGDVSGCIRSRDRR